MLFLVFIPLVLCAGICLFPICLLRRPFYLRAQDYFVSSQPTPPAVIRNSSIAYVLRIAAFGPFFAWGANGDLWPAIISTVFFGLGLLLLYVFRGPMLEFLNRALDHDGSITVHAFVAQQHGNDRRVLLLASSLTLFALFGLVVGESVAVAALLKPLLGNTALVYLSVLGMLTVAAAGAILSGQSGVMQSTQLQLGMAYLGLFGSTALLLYLHVSALTPMPPHGAFAVAFVAVWCAVILWYRRSKYVDTNIIRVTDPKADDTGRVPPGAKMLKKFEQILNPCISVFVVLVVVVAGMEFYFEGFLSIGHQSIAALQAGVRLPGAGLLALALLSLLYPMVDVTGWQRIAAIEKDSDAGQVGSGRDAKMLRGMCRLYAAEGPLLWLFMCLFGAIAAIATETPIEADVMPVFMAKLVEDQNEVTVVVLPLLLVGMFAIALSAMMSMFSAGLCTLRFDVLPQFWPEPASSKAENDETIAIRRTIIAGAGFFLTVVISFFLADALLRVGFATSAFLALLVAFCCAQFSFATLVLGPMLLWASGDLGAVSPQWALTVMGCSVASGAAAVAIYVASGNEAWLWATVPACLGMGLLVFTVATMTSASRARH